MGDVVTRVLELARAARMLAVVGASIKLRSAAGTDLAIGEQVERGVELALGDDAAALRGAEPAELLPMIEMALIEGRDLLQNAGLPAGWRVEDPAALEAIGRASSGVFDRILALAKTRPGLRRSLAGRFLDVGTGVGGIALRAVETCPSLAVEAIDIWPPALRIAERRVAASRHATRVELYELDIAELDPEPRFTLAWLPTMFMRRQVVRQAVARIAMASNPGGWVVAALYSASEDEFTAVMSTLRTLRSGGEITDPGELVDLLRSSGYVDVEIDVAPIATFVIGRLP